jgi:hypothetical protein
MLNFFVRYKTKNYYIRITNYIYMNTRSGEIFLEIVRPHYIIYNRKDVLTELKVITKQKN